MHLGRLKRRVFFWENVSGLPQKPWLWIEKTKKQEGTSSAISDVGTAAKCCEIRRCSDRVCSRTDNKDEILEGKFRNLNFSPSTKRTTEYTFERFLSIYRYLIFFPQVLSFTSVELNQLPFFSKATVVMPLPAKKNAGCPKAPCSFPLRKKWYSLLPVGLSWDSPPPPPESVRTDGRTYADITTKFSRIDR